MHFTFEKINYRQDIEALRGFAVLSVLLFHAGFDLFQGGFLGVDIFFVISGYLITKTLIDEQLKNNNINYISFFIRRARRIFPALIFTLFLSTLLAIIFFSTSLLSQYGNSLIFASLSASNIYFYTQSGYFDASSYVKPLLHTWSLGVEEQFYLLWPIFMGMVLSFRSKLKDLLPFLILAIGLLSLLGAQYMISKSQAASFFIMPFRVFEFALGGLLYWVNLDKFKKLSNLLFIFALALLIYSIFFFNEKMLFPGFNALVPCMGAALFISANKQKNLVSLYKYLGFSFLGKISYSLYLVHWPIVVFWGIGFNVSKYTLLDSLLILTASIVISSISYYFVESPFRRIRSKNSSFIIKCFILFSILIMIGLSQSFNNGWDWRPWRPYEILSSDQVKKEKELRFSVRQKICIEKGWDKCDDIDPNKKNVLIIGDSHSIDALNAFVSEFSDLNYSLSTLPGCPPYGNIELIAPKDHFDLEKCKALNKTRVDVGYLKKFNLIVINNYMKWYRPDHLISYLQYLHINGIDRVIVFGNYLSLDQEMPILINKYGLDEAKIKKSIQNEDFNESELKRVCEEFNYLYLSKKSIFCEGSNCIILSKNKIPFTYDTNHLSFEFAKELLAGKKSIVSDYIARVSP
ncbi:acyltransferase family protein [Polynucleobacter sp. AP-Melu-500A-A1]|uniref:acyltransferase family protein n=1 Tax=Polynucleobacter sp. AP-Melu-500A-A1 TaxID=2576929 RepID=UPI001C0E1F72|nr:acyltransferase family protein [Polynucleobacter sp. AP-Melu-500A-A1]MBU3630086.1 acyltransferase [Polynucleobacter sp. AP-Melu-500A-A1]